METIDLTGRKGLVVGIADKHSLAGWAAQHFRKAGAELAITFLNDTAKPHVAPRARHVEAPIALPYRVSVPCQLEALIKSMARGWGGRARIGERHG